MTRNLRATSRDELPQVDPLPIISQVLCIFTCKDCTHQWTAVGGQRSDGTISIEMGQGIQPGEQGDPTVCGKCGSRRSGLHILDAGAPAVVIRIPVQSEREHEPQGPTLWDALDATSSKEK